MPPVVPCPLCGYHAPGPACPHCGGAPRLASLARRPAGPVAGVVDGLLAVPMGLWLLATTRGTKRWLVPPLLVTSGLVVGALWWTFRWIDRTARRIAPDELALAPPSWEWVERWGWLETTVAALVGSLEWSLNAAWGFLGSRPLTWLLYFFVGSLVAWYGFAIVYEALAGPFLDEVQARLERRWFGADPRARLERPTAIPEERCARWTIAAAAAAGLVLLAGLVVPGLPFWIALLASPLPFAAAALADREYGTWLRWMARVEARATWVSLQAAAITAVLLVLALPLYFVPFGIGYVLFACATGFATAVGLLDIPFERRGIRLRVRLRFLARNGLPLVAFGVVAGLLLSVPVVGAVLMVPAASAGGLWLVCRLDKTPLRPPASPPREPGRAGGGAAPP